MEILNFKSGNNETAKYWKDISQPQKLKILSELGGKYFAEYIKKMQDLNALITSTINQGK